MAEKRVQLEDASGATVGAVNIYGHPAELAVSSGQVTAFVTLAGATGDTVGRPMDAGSSHQNCTLVCVGTGTLTGTLTIEMSLDGVTWVSTGTTVALTAGGTVTATQGARAARYWRVSLSGSAGTGTATCSIMANGG